MALRGVLGMVACPVGAPGAANARARGARECAKITALEEAFTRALHDHHGFLLATMLARVDALDADITALEHKIEEMVAPFAQAVQRLNEIPGSEPPQRR